MSEQEALKGRIEAIRARVAEVAARVGRDAGDVALMAVTKTRTVQEMEAAASFVDVIGENKVQEAVVKRQNIIENNILRKLPWRLIGHLQGNKARRAVELFDAVDSLDSIPLAERLDRIAGELGRDLPVLIEVNTSGEASKTGVAAEEFPALLDRVLALPRLRLEGLMTLGPLTDDEADVRRAFASLRELAERARTRSGLPLPVLSMGMSGDFPWAVQEGSTMVRIGSALFGPRDYTKM